MINVINTKKKTLNSGGGERGTGFRFARVIRQRPYGPCDRFSRPSKAPFLYENFMITVTV